MRDILKQILIKEEGIALNPYECPAGFPTIGVGHNMDAKPLPDHMQALMDEGLPITNEMAFELLESDMDESTSDAETFGWYHLLDDVRQAVVVAMIFQMGLSGFKHFKRMIGAMDRGDYGMAAVEMLDSKWAKHDSPERAKRMARRMRDGV